MDDERSIDIDGIKVNRQAADIMDKMLAMGQLGLPKVWTWEGDDGPESYATLDSLRDYVADFGGCVVRLGRGTAEPMTLPSPLTRPGADSGNFLVYVE